VWASRPRLTEGSRRRLPHLPDGEVPFPTVENRSRRAGFPRRSCLFPGRLVELDRKLPAILSGRAKPGDVGSTCGLAQVCYGKKLHGASARLWAEALRTQPQIVEDPRAGHRYKAVCAAGLAGSGQGKDDPPLDDATKTRWRKQAINWLKADQRVWSRLRDSGPRQARPFIIKTLQSWKADPDLVSLRDPAALAKLPREEPDACRALWSEVDTLLAKFKTTEP
jgi:hypothetical protein